MGEPLIYENAQIVTADDLFGGYVVVQDGLITELGAGRAPGRGIDLDGDYLLPGLIEIHTDNLEAHYVPRPKVQWHVGSAVLSYDAQIATSGITTVFDSLRIGVDAHELRNEFGNNARQLADAIADAGRAGLLRADHRLHLRCEVPAQDVVAQLEAFLTNRTVDLISLMDHTPGQRQFRDIDKYFTYYIGKTGKGVEEVRAVVAHRQANGAAAAAANRPAVVAMAHGHGIRLASHDDTTLDEVAQSVTEGVSIAEFPTTIAAAEASRAAGMATVMGAPNVVRGGSHSGNVAASDLARAGALDILSSDYVPASLLVAAFYLSDVPGVGGLPGAVCMVSRNPALATGLMDRGEIARGKRADLIRVRLVDDLPVARQIWCAGTRVA